MTPHKKKQYEFDETVYTGISLLPSRMRRVYIRTTFSGRILSKFVWAEIPFRPVLGGRARPLAHLASPA
jgi:hypothetical protein